LIKFNSEEKMAAIQEKANTLELNDLIEERRASIVVSFRGIKQNVYSFYLG
jgi:hypothetical protein